MLPRMTTKDDDWAQALAATIAAARTELGLSRLAMIERTGMARSTYYRIEEGERAVSTSQLRVIARALGLTPGQLFDRADANAAEIPDRKTNAQKAQEYRDRTNPPEQDERPRREDLA